MQYMVQNLTFRKVPRTNCVGGGHSLLLEQKVFWAHLKHWNFVQILCPSEYCETHVTKLVRHGTSLKSKHPQTIKGIFMAAAGKLGRWKYWAKHFHLKLRQYNQATLVSSSSSSSSLHLPLGLPAPVASQRYKLGWDWIWARQIHAARRAALLARARWHQRCRHRCQSRPSFHEGVKVEWDPSRRSCDRNAGHFGDWHSGL